MPTTYLPLDVLWYSQLVSVVQCIFPPFLTLPNSCIFSSWLSGQHLPCCPSQNAIALLGFPFLTDPHPSRSNRYLSAILFLKYFSYLLLSFTAFEIPSAASFFLPPLYWQVKSKNAYPTHCLCWMGSPTNKLSCDPSGPKLLITTIRSSSMRISESETHRWLCSCGKTEAEAVQRRQRWWQGECRHSWVNRKWVSRSYE